VRIFTLGHSTRNFEDFLKILKKFQIELVIDVRRFPSSKKFPWFNKENLEKELTKNKIEYIHFPELGGYRKEGYEEFAKSEEFANVIKKILKIMGERKSLILCSEFKWWKCHRRYIANFLAELGHEVIHIFNENKTQEHKLKSKEIEEKMKRTLKCDKISEFLKI
jgi:uncharacterized protein (DUF488 family)